VAPSNSNRHPAPGIVRANGREPPSSGPFCNPSTPALVPAFDGPRPGARRAGRAVLDIVKRMNENVKLSVPEAGRAPPRTRPVHLAAERSINFTQVFRTLQARIPGMGVNPMLKTRSTVAIHGKIPGDALQTASGRAVGVGRCCKSFDNSLQIIPCSSRPPRRTRSGACDKKGTNLARACARAWNAWPASCKMVSTSRWQADGIHE